MAFVNLKIKYGYIYFRRIIQAGQLRGSLLSDTLQIDHLYSS